MGLKKALGLGGKGNIHIKLEKMQYFPGEVVRGNLLVTVTDPIECDKIIVKAKGSEKVFWQETRYRTRGGERERYEQNFSGSKYHFNEVIPLGSSDKQVIPVGEWVYPFEYKLPDKLPDFFVFDKKQRNRGELNTIKAKIVYTFKGTLDVSGVFASDLQDKAAIVIINTPLEMVPPPLMEKTETVTVCCCFSVGEVEISVQSDKGAYTIGETAKINVKLENRTSNDIAKMKARLIRIFVLAARGHTKVWRTEVQELSYEGCTSGGKLDQIQDLPMVASALLPSTSSTHICCKYIIEIKCAVSGASDVLLNIPIQLSLKPEQLSNNVAAPESD